LNGKKILLRTESEFRNPQSEISFLCVLCDLCGKIEC